MADRARRQTNKLLRGLEKEVRGVYRSDFSLLRIQKQYEAYMEDVKKATYDSYKAYKKAPIGSDERRKLKKVYTDEVRELTIKNKTYQAIVAEFTRIMASVNQRALSLINSDMEDVYMINYNQVAVDCRKVGIKVENNG